jgi:hypothetical protein
VIEVAQLARIKEGAVPMSNNQFSVASHFTGKEPETRKIYDRLLKTSGAFGRFTEDPKKTSIHLVNRTAFAGVATRKTAIVLTIKSDRKLASPRIHKSEQTSASRFHHEVKLTSPAEIDAELTGWLKAAYELSE